MDLESLGQQLLRGVESLGAGARNEARRVLDVLIERGDLSRDEAGEIEAGVQAAVATQRRWIEERVLGPLGLASLGHARPAPSPSAASASLGRVLRAADGGRLDARLAALEERLARIEALLAARDAGE